MPNVVPPAPVGTSRSVVQSVLARETPEGDGATVRRSIGTDALRNLSPFLMLDHFKVERGAGFPDHPHRGQVTVTYMLEGKFQHEDFVGHKGIIGAGDLQWMTAGRGIVHAEMPLHSDGGPDPSGLQLWLDLPAEHKLTDPTYQELRHDDIPTARVSNGASVKVISGESHGSKSPVRTLGGCWYFDIRLPAGASIYQAIPKGWSAFAYTLSGSLGFGGTESAAPLDSKPVEPYHTVVFTNNPSEDGLRIQNTGEGEARLVVIAGEPLDQPIVQYGPFVMTTRAEIMQAFQDYRSGKNGFENAHVWASEIGRGAR